MAHKSLPRFTKPFLVRSRGEFFFLVVSIILCILVVRYNNLANQYEDEMKFQSNQINHLQKRLLEVDEVQNHQLVDSIKNYLYQIRVRFPEVTLKQFQIESANFTSKLFRDANNPCGMMFPSKRPTTASGKYISSDSLTYAKYDSWKEGILDFVIWQSLNTNHLKNQEDYLDFLNQYYAEDENYREKINPNKKFATL